MINNEETFKGSKHYKNGSTMSRVTLANEFDKHKKLGYRFMSIRSYTSKEDGKIYYSAVGHTTRLKYNWYFCGESKEFIDSLEETYDLRMSKEDQVNARYNVMNITN